MKNVDLKELNQKMVRHQMEVGIMNFDGDRMYKLLQLEGDTIGKIPFIQDVAEYDDFIEHLDEMKKLTPSEREQIFHLAVVFAEAVGREAFVSGFNGVIKKSRTAATDRLTRMNA